MTKYVKNAPTIFSVCLSFVLVLSRPAGAEDVSTPDSTAQRSPTGAVLRSLALPGWGQFYNRRRIKGSLVAAAEIGSVAALLVEAGKGTDPVTGLERPNRRRLFTLTTLGIVFYSMVDAYVDAHLDMVDWGEVQAEPEAAGVRVRLKVRF